MFFNTNATLILKLIFKQQQLQTCSLNIYPTLLTLFIRAKIYTGIILVEKEAGRPPMRCDEGKVLPKDDRLSMAALISASLASDMEAVILLSQAVQIETLIPI